MPEIFVDADACPVKDEVLRVAERHGLRVTFVSNGGLRPSRDPMLRVVTVGKGADAADDWIVAEARAQDLVVTADILLARRCLETGALPIGPDGRVFSAESIGMAVAMRDLHAHLRETGNLAGSGKVFTPKDRSAFLSAFDTLVHRARRAAGG